MKVVELIEVLRGFPLEADVEMALGGTGDRISAVRLEEDRDVVGTVTRECEVQLALGSAVLSD